MEVVPDPSAQPAGVGTITCPMESMHGQGCGHAVSSREELKVHLKHAHGKEAAICDHKPCFHCFDTRQKRRTHQAKYCEYLAPSSSPSPDQHLAATVPTRRRTNISGSYQQGGGDSMSASSTSSSSSDRARGIGGASATAGQGGASGEDGTPEAAPSTVFYQGDGSDMLYLPQDHPLHHHLAVNTVHDVLLCRQCNHMLTPLRDSIFNHFNNNGSTHDLPTSPSMTQREALTTWLKSSAYLWEGDDDFPRSLHRYAPDPPECVDGSPPPPVAGMCATAGYICVVGGCARRCGGRAFVSISLKNIKIHERTCGVRDADSSSGNGEGISVGEATAGGALRYRPVWLMTYKLGPEIRWFEVSG